MLFAKKILSGAIYLIALLSFIPLFGAPFAVVLLIVFWLSRYQNKKLCIAVLVGLVLNCILFAFYVSLVFGVYSSASTLNSRAPLLVKEGVRFDKVSITGRELMLEFTMLDMEYGAYDFSKLENEFIPEQEKEICQRYQSQIHYDLGYTVTYKYKDKNLKEILSVSTSGMLCDMISGEVTLPASLMPPISPFDVLKKQSPPA